MKRDCSSLFYQRLPAAVGRTLWQDASDTSSQASGLKRQDATNTLGIILFTVWLFGIAIANNALAETSRPQPNIVLLIADDLGYGELGCQGNSEIPTPFIDALAETGVRCTQAYVTAPNCSPSRAGLLSGRIPTRFGYEFNPIGARNEEPGAGLPSKERLLPELLHDQGYTTALIGKWHLGGTAAYHPQRHGFDEFFGFTHEGHYFVPPPWRGTTTMLRRKALPRSATGSRHNVTEELIYTSHMGHDEPDYDANNPILRIGQPVAEEEYLTDALAREACDFIDRFQSSPFFLTVTFNAVHSPLQAKNETLAKFSRIEDMHRRIFAAMLSDLDKAVGRITAKLDKCQIREDTLIIFLSDNGGPTKELTSSNLPLRDGKGSMYEGGFRVPFIYSWRGRIPEGKVCDQVLTSLDILPTALAAAGAPSASGKDGLNILPTLEDLSQQLPDRTLYWRQGHRAALRRGDWKVVSPRREQNRKGPRVWELYNVASDISETRNLAAEEPDRLEALVEAWETLDAEMQEPAF